MSRIVEKCDSCNEKFGTKGKDGREVFQAYGSDSNICTACALFESREQSRRVDQSYVNRINGR